MQPLAGWGWPIVVPSSSLRAPRWVVHVVNVSETEYRQLPPEELQVGAGARFPVDPFWIPS